MFFYKMREKKSKKKETGIEIDQLLMFSCLDESYPVEMADIYLHRVATDHVQQARQVKANRRPARGAAGTFAGQGRGHFE